MTGREELAALLFELQRARGPVDKARAAARAWRTLRELSPGERRMIAREIGSSGADELLESLSGGGRGFSPAAVLEALTRIDDDEQISLDEIVAELRDPERRPDAVGDVLDEAAEAATAEEESQEEAAPDVEPDAASDDAAPQIALPPVPAIDEMAPPGPAPEHTAAALPEGDGEWGVGTAEPPGPQPRPVMPPPPSVWDEVLRQPSTAPVPVPERTAEGLEHPADGAPRVGERPLAVLQRLRQLRARRDELAVATVDSIRTALDAFPEPWARRRALCFLLAEGIPAHVGDALDLVAELERPSDRRWCLGVLADSGALVGDHLDRAVALLASPAARRRLAHRAGGHHG